MTLLESINANPLPGAMVLVALLIIQQIVAKWKGGNNADRINVESNRLAQQTSETVNSCATKTTEIMVRIDEYIQSNHVGQLSTRLEHAVQVLEAMANSQNVHETSLDRIIDLCDSINNDLQRTDSRLVHETMLHEINTVKAIAQDVKQLSVHIAEKV